jgi:hypothetical protein
LQVIVRVGADQAERVVAALGTEATIRLVVLDGAVRSGRAGATLADGCVAPGPPSGFRLAGRSVEVSPPSRSRAGGVSSAVGAAGPGMGRGGGQPGVATRAGGSR